MIDQQQAETALAELQPYLEQYKDDVVFLEIYGEVLLEVSDLENLYEVLMRACELDPVLASGVEKFLNLGQIIGGEDGLKLLNVGLSKLESQLLSLVKLDSDRILKKLNQCIFAEIEIWMTDLCMLEELEQRCDELISKSLKLDESNPETWSLLASIRISQQRKQDLLELVARSWAIFQQVKSQYEQDSDNSEYVELIQPLLTLCKYSIELELFDTAVEIASQIQDINENCLESYYLEGFANYLEMKKMQNPNLTHPIGEVFMELPALKLDDQQIESQLLQTRLSFTNGLKLKKMAASDDDLEVLSMMTQLVQECGGSLKRKEMLELENIQDNWEDEIDSDN